MVWQARVDGSAFRTTVPRRVPYGIFESLQMPRYDANRKVHLPKPNVANIRQMKGSCNILPQDSVNTCTCEAPKYHRTYAHKGFQHQHVADPAGKHMKSSSFSGISSFVLESLYYMKLTFIFQDIKKLDWFYKAFAQRISQENFQMKRPRASGSSQELQPCSMSMFRISGLYILIISIVVDSEVEVWWR